MKYNSEELCVKPIIISHLEFLSFVSHKFADVTQVPLAELLEGLELRDD